MGHGCGQRQHHGECRALPHTRCRFDAATQGLHFGAHHVHTDATPGQLRHLGGGGESGLEDQGGGIGFGEVGVVRDQPQGLRLAADGRNVEAPAVVAERDGHVVAFLLQPNGDAARAGFSQRSAVGGVFDAVHHGVAQQVFEGGGHAVEHTPVHLDRTAGNVQRDLFAGFLRGLAHHGVQAFGDAFKLHHPCTQQVALQFTGLAALGDQVVLGAFQRALQAALHGGHVVDRLGHHAGQFLHAGEAVEFERVECGVGVFGLRQTRLHLRLGLHLDVAQLLAQTVQVARQVAQGAPHLAQPHVQARPRDHHFAHLVDQAVEQCRTHPHRLVGRRAQRGHGRCGGQEQLGRCRSSGGRCVSRCCRHQGHHHGRGRHPLLGRHTGLRRSHNGVLHLFTQHTQRIEVGLQAVEAGKQRLDLRNLQVFGVEPLNGRLQPVRQFAQAHGTRQTRAAFECVQGAQRFVAGTAVVGPRRPLAQCTTQAG